MQTAFIITETNLGDNLLSSFCRYDLEVLVYGFKFMSGDDRC